MEVVGGSMRVITIYAILDEHNNLLSTAKTEEEAIKYFERKDKEVVDGIRGKIKEKKNEKTGNN